MVKRTVLDVKFYDNELDPYMIFIHSQDDILSKANRIRVTTKHGSYDFNAKVKPCVPEGAMGVNYQLRKVYHVKNHQSYEVSVLTPVEPPKGISDILKTKFEFGSKVGGLDDTFESIFGDVLLTPIYPESFVTKTSLTKPKGIILHGPSGTDKTLIPRTICKLLNIQPTIVSDPEIFSRMFGESEQKIRNLFERTTCQRLNYGFFVLVENQIWVY